MVCSPNFSWRTLLVSLRKHGLNLLTRLGKLPWESVYTASCQGTYSSISDGETSFAGHLMAVRKQMVTKNPCALPLARGSETQSEPQGWPFLDSISWEMRRPRHEKNGQSGHWVSISAHTIVNNRDNNNTHFEDSLWTRRCSKPFRHIQYGGVHWLSCFFIAEETEAARG